MSFSCGNVRTKGLHQHDTVEDAKICYGILAATSKRFPPVAPPPDIATDRQVEYIKSLGGDGTLAMRLTKREASEYIERLRATQKAGSTVHSSEPPRRPVTDPRVEMLQGLIRLVPVGYYAVQEYDGGHVDFIRISSPKNGRFRNSLKIQTVHGSGAGKRLDNAAALWPSGQMSIFKREVIDALLLLCTDYQGAAMRYAEKIGNCCRCNAELTDGRSRYFGIGPECEKSAPWVIENVLERKGPFRGER